MENNRAARNLNLYIDTNLYVYLGGTFKKKNKKIFPTKYTPNLRTTTIK